MPQDSQSVEADAKCMMSVHRPFVYRITVPREMLPPDIDLLKVYPGDSHTDKLPKRGYKTIKRVFFRLKPGEGSYTAFFVCEVLSETSCRISVYIKDDAEPSKAFYSLKEKLGSIPGLSIEENHKSIRHLVAA